MGQYARSDNDLKKQKATRNSWRQANKTPRPPQTLVQRNVRPFRSINNLQEESGQSLTDQAPTYRRQTSNIGASTILFAVAKAPYCTVCDENVGHVTKDCKYNRMVRKLKENDDAARSSEPSKHVFHSASHEIVSHQPFSQPYIPTSISTMQQPSYSQVQGSNMAREG